MKKQKQSKTKQTTFYYILGVFKGDILPLTVEVGEKLKVNLTAKYKWQRSITFFLSVTVSLVGHHFSCS